MISRNDRRLNSRETLACMSVMHHLIGENAHPRQLADWAVAERPTYNPEGWEQADETYRRSRREAIDWAARNHFDVAGMGSAVGRGSGPTDSDRRSETPGAMPEPSP